MGTSPPDLPPLETEQRWLVRHAQSAGNAAGIVQGQRRRIPLSPLGRVQAMRLATALATHEWSTPPLVVSSDLRRAVETARPVARRLGVRLHTDRALRERSFGVLEGRPWSDDLGEQIGLVDGRVVDADARPRRGESLQDLHDRVAAGLDRLLCTHPHRSLVVVSHGGAIRVARAHVAGVPLEGLRWEPVANATPEPLLPFPPGVAAGLLHPAQAVSATEGSEVAPGTTPARRSVGRNHS